MFSEDLDTFLKDFGIPVSSGLVSGLGILDMPDNILGDGVSISTNYNLIVKTSEFGNLRFNDKIEADGISYKVRSFRQIDDGVFGRLELQKDD